jgi:hypothetical protein
MFCLAKRVLQRALRWAALSFALNLLWETAHSSLYTYPDASGQYIAYAILHCTVGDAFIAMGSFLLASFVLRDRDWPYSQPWAGGAIAAGFGLLYTVFSEWYNVSQTGNWGYAANMPLIFGIGLTPLLQWLVLPSLTVLCLRKIGTTEKRTNSGECTDIRMLDHHETPQPAPK